MSMAMVTRGRLWPNPVVKRDHFVDISSEISDLIVVDVDVTSAVETEVRLLSGEIVATVEVRDGIESDIDVTVSVDGTVKEC